VAIKQALFELRMKRSLRQEVKPHEFKHLKHELSQLLTVEHQRKQGASEGSASESGSSEPDSSEPSSSEE
ncbi:MAG: 50S ribosomal protein L29, partial [Cyanophyceae cyanobacterium]